MAITGVVRETKGEVKIISADGSERLLEKGSNVYADEQISTGVRGAVSIELANGTNIEIEPESQITLNTEGVKAVTEAKEQDQSEDAQSEVTEMQQALIDGILIEDQPATAAGKTHATTGQDENDGSSFVDVTKTDKRGVPGGGFDTKGINVAFGSSITELILNPVIEPSVVSVPIPVVTESPDLVNDDNNVIHNQSFYIGNIPRFNNAQLRFSFLADDSGTEIIEVRIPIASLFNNDPGSALELVSVSNPQGGTVR
ncbi:MAG: retention module-containing protein, partial [Methylococcales bacterium]|nr:retention module-containing protein [Methylococcales bacterium]